MCGLAGYLTRAPVTPDASLLRALFASIRARGPDDEGVCLMDRTAGAMRAFHTERSVARHRALLPSYSDTAAWIRSEERRVGKARRTRGEPRRHKKKTSKHE